jgi:MOSC domain-containing protein YiiM
MQTQRLGRSELHRDHRFAILVENAFRRLSMLQPALQILQIFISPGHNFYGHNGMAPGEHPTLAVPEIHCVPGRGIEGDRFFDFKAGYKGQITFFSQEVYGALCEQLKIRDKSPGALRRNVICAGVDLNTLIGQDFEVQGVVFRGREECRPCHWMNEAFGEGAEEAMRGRGGLRAEILGDGVLRVSADRSGGGDER